MIEYIKGNIFKDNNDVIVQGCNCQCTMNSGFAKQVRLHYPEAYEADTRTVKGNKAKLGTYTHCKVAHQFIPNRDIIIINAYTQFDYGYDGKNRFNYEAFEAILKQIKIEFGHLQIAMPKIGAGLAGGDWCKIESIINKIFDTIIIKVYVI